MILYDQNFKFIGMSAETLTFLGYEDLEEFCSMHGDFADLFIKREGYIHKFENFSWIHYILYSGAANKKALIGKKNGGELSVEITIKEVFLNQAYDGLEKIYSVKLINENFTTISKTDVHDQRSHQNSHFSLQNLTKDFNISQPDKQESKESKPLYEKPAISKPLLDIEKEFQAPKEEIKEPEINLPEHSGFILGSFEDTQTKEDHQSEEIDDFKEFEPKDEKNEILKIEENIKPFEHIPPKKEEEDEKSESSNTAFFNALKNEQSKETALNLENDNLKEVEEEQKPFELNFDLLKVEKSDTNEAKELKTVENKEPQNETSLDENEFSLELFDIKSNENETKEADLKIDQNRSKESLISQIKSDIKEIDQDVKEEPSEQKEAAMELKELLKIDIAQNDTKTDETEKKKTTVETKHDENETIEMKNQNNLLDFLKKEPDEDDKKEPVDIQTLNADKSLSETSQKENSFEETLKNVFAAADKNEKNDDAEITFSLVHENEDNDDKIARNQQSINKEPIKSDDNIELTPKMKTEISLPSLGSLGLSKEEELDFIDEFLNDTQSTTALIEEYIKIDDFDNIKYSLIKIKSSAEILGFDAMIDIVKSLAKLCDDKDKVAIEQKLNELKEDTKIYREHFAAIAV